MAGYALLPPFPFSASFLEMLAVGASHGESPEEGRLRVLNACNACKAGRRRCDGAVACSGCRRRGIVCTYALNKKRGRKTQQDEGSVTSVVAHPAVTSGHSAVRIHALPHSQLPSFVTRELRTMEFLTAEERQLLRTVFGYTNRIFTAGMCADWDC